MKCVTGVAASVAPTAITIGRKMSLPLDVSRCAGRYDFDPLRSETCPERKTCQRYLAWLSWDRKAGIQNYKGIPVSMAVRDCEHKIEVSEE